jgi:hypothetical protein|tara:strand:+ start:112 stop:354 length:243 start_codon:yes stop_codon:yes gene_type:complete
MKTYNKLKQELFGEDNFWSSNNAQNKETIFQRLIRQQSQRNADWVRRKANRIFGKTQTPRQQAGNEIVLKPSGQIKIGTQ